MSPILGIIASQNYPRITSSYESIATVTVGSGGSSTITFSSIPATYTHLQIRGLFGASSSGQAYSVNFNSDTGSNYSYHYLAGQGSSAFTGASTNRTFTLLTDTSGSGVTTSPTAFIMDLLDYRSTSKAKTMKTLIGNDANGSGQIYLVSGLWFATPAAITSINIDGLSGATFTQYSSFALYGCKA